ncbi:nuclease SbcCD subunit D [Shewanella sp. NFH-SH190041]|uniref:exonuclease subunit SbcD n=1 Tax=Shewanella sp. NFH-SH190041 TaxID=2950245 RepID=UPI0021C33160|nr:exonuclease subunit SbcD [Shewanella sp. NFH-SH190041]BDM64995.1 nuclease SbcCD subunit D [Shewanella sp. NFH-SH190041]
MRILHTSDWHLGQSFYGKSRAPEHRAFLNWLLEQIPLQQIDAVIVAGDIFDTSAPPSYARELYNHFVVNMQQYHCQLFVLGGNHDSVAMLSESQELLACIGTQVVPSVQTDISKQVFALYDADGQIGAVLGAVPYLRPRELITSEAGEDGSRKQRKLGEAIKAHYEAIFAAARALTDAPVPVILTGHLTTVGASSSESVRDIYIGTLDAFNAHAFPQADYIALGHIHRAQKVAKSEHIRYSGSPICLSFDELSSPKQVLIAEFDPHGLTQVTELAVPTFQPLVSLNGDLETIATQIDAIPLPDNGTVWLSVTVESQEYLSDLQSRVQALVEGRPFEVLQLKRLRQQSQMMTATAQETLSELSVEDVFARRVALAQFDSPAEQLRLERMKQMYQAVVAQVQQQDETPRQQEAVEHDGERSL